MPVFFPIYFYYYWPLDKSLIQCGPIMCYGGTFIRLSFKALTYKLFPQRIDKKDVGEKKNKVINDLVKKINPENFGPSWPKLKSLSNRF